MIHSHSILVHRAARGRLAAKHDAALQHIGERAARQNTYRCRGRPANWIFTNEFDARRESDTKNKSRLSSETKGKRNGGDRLRIERARTGGAPRRGLRQVLRIASGFEAALILSVYRTAVTGRRRLSTYCSTTTQHGGNRCTCAPRRAMDFVRLDCISHGKCCSIRQSRLGDRPHWRGAVPPALQHAVATRQRLTCVWVLSLWPTRRADRGEF